MFEDDGLVDDYPLEPLPEDPHQRGPFAALLWGAFLGCSWTWIIGMVFPAMLLRDYGLRGWAAFAIPNVVGAAAMGTVLFKPTWSADIVRKHAVACHNFSVVTIAFHLYVITWLFTGLFGFAAVPMIVVAVGLCVGLGIRSRNNSAMLYVAVGVAVLSLGCFAWATKAPGAWDLAQWSPASPRLSHTDFLYFIPCSVLGFLLCPYLDLTFHRARINTAGGAGPSAFAFGFGVVFFAMIIFSVCYGAQLLPFIAGDPEAVLPGLWLALLGIHLTIQAAFTLTIHARETIEDRVTGGISLPWLIGACGIAIVLGFAVQIDDLPSKPMTGGLSWGEAGYRGFLLLYGTVFPAYVWLIMIPTGRRPLTRLSFEVRTGIYALSSALAFALAWIAFVRGDTFLVPYIFGLLIVCRIAIQLLPTQKPDPDLDMDLDIDLDL
ncbi:hypothetical protein OT109_05775 [Phycisphaeraceae bacterium D3-23]